MRGCRRTVVGSLFRTGPDPRATKIFVTDLPTGRRRWEIVNGESCQWVKGGAELICQNSDLELVSYRTKLTGQSFEWSAPEVLFQLRNKWWVGDGDRFVISQRSESTPEKFERLELLLNWERLLDDR